MQPGTSASANNLVPAPRSRTRQHRRIPTFLAFVLPTVVAIQTAFAVDSPPAPIEVFAPGIHNYLSQVHFPAIEPHLHLLPVSIEPHFSRKDLPPGRAIWSTCGWGVINPTTVAPRITKLPADPVLVLAHGYLKCKSIRSALFDPQVSVADHPAGHFGDYEYAGLLVPAWIEFFDETSLREIFHTLTNLADGPDDLWFADYEVDDPPVKLADYRRTTGFTPELLIEFVGGTNMRIELNFTQGRMLIQVDDRWDFYHLNQHQAGLLREIVAAGKNTPPATRSSLGRCSTWRRCAPAAVCSNLTRNFTPRTQRLLSLPVTEPILFAFGVRCSSGGNDQSSPVCLKYGDRGDRRRKMGSIRSCRGIDPHSFIQLMKNAALFFTLTALISFMSCGTGCMTVRRKKPETAMQRLGARSPDQIEGFLDKRLTTKLDLTSAQLPRVYAIDLDYAMKIQAAAASHQDPATKTRTMDKANDAYSTDLQTVLSADQFAQFLTMKDELRTDINNGAGLGK